MLQFGYDLQLATLLNPSDKPPAKRFMGLFCCTLGIIRQVVILGTDGQSVLLFFEAVVHSLLLALFRY
jgi:hypothetical protein